MLELFSIIFGLIFGSFLNVIIYRLPRKIFFIKSRSFCPNCKYKIPFYSNIPIISYVFQRGRCVKCSGKISIKYPTIELFSALIWFWAISNYNFSQALLFIWICSILIAIAFIDHETLQIPLPLIISALLGILVYIFFNSNEWKIAFWGATMGIGYLSLVFLLTSIIFKKQTLGFGDIQLIAITGMFLGPINVLFSIFISAFAALLVWVTTSFIIGFDRNRAIPFGPYLSISAIILYAIDINLFNLL